MKKIDMIKACLSVLWKLTVYVIVGLPMLILLLPTSPYINSSKQIKNIWIWFDRIVATIIHFTWKRTISGITGQYMNKKLRYKYQAKVIDKLALLVNDDEDHCARVYRWEQLIGVC